MKSGFVKNVALLGISALMLTACAGCVSNEDNRNILNDKNLVAATNAMIVVEENGIHTLHRGDVLVPVKDYQVSGSAYKGFGHDLPPILSFECGKEVMTNQFVVYTQGFPSEEYYDVVCPCVHLTTKSSDGLTK